MLWWKFAKFLMSFFKPQVSFCSNFASLFSVMKELLCTFLAETYALVRRSLFKFFRLSNARVKVRQIHHVNSSSICVSFFIVMTYNSSINFKLIHFLHWTKSSHQSPIFDTFVCTGKIFLNSSCHFPNHKSVFFQIWHQSSVSWDITPL